MTRSFHSLASGHPAFSKSALEQCNLSIPAVDDSESSEDQRECAAISMSEH